VYKRRLDSVREHLAGAGAELFWSSAAANRRWLSGFTGSSGAVVIGREKAWLLVDFRYTEQAGAEAPPEVEVVEVEEIHKGIAALCANLAVRKGCFDSRHTTYKNYQKLGELAPQVEWLGVENWVETGRGRKDQAELAALSRAVELADVAFTHIIDMIKPGIPERELALELEYYMRRAGAEGTAFPVIVASGPRGALPHGRPSERRLAAGDLVTMDFGAIYAGYCSDITRTVAVGHCDARQRELYNLVLTAQLAGIEAVTPGKTGREVDAAAREIIQAAGYGANFGHGLGHGIGLEVHEEFPRLSRTSEVMLQPGMVCSVEPGVYLPGWGGIRIEDLVLVEEKGCRVLTKSSKELLVVG